MEVLRKGSYLLQTVLGRLQAKDLLHVQWGFKGGNQICQVVPFGRVLQPVWRFKPAAARGRFIAPGTKGRRGRDEREERRRQ